MLNDNETHHLVALLELSTYPRPIEMILGDKILDVTTKTKRDVDIVKIEQWFDGCPLIAAIEVKAEKGPLGTPTVEQLAIKFNDMPTIARKMIVSSSGYSAPAILKAKAHGISLCSLVDWDPVSQPYGTDVSRIKQIDERLWLWKEISIKYETTPRLLVQISHLDNNTEIVSLNGSFSEINSFPKLEKYIAHRLRQELIKSGRITQIVKGNQCPIEEHVNLSNFGIHINSTIYILTSAQITGVLECSIHTHHLLFKQLVSEPERKPIIACGIWEITSSDLQGFIVTPELKPIQFIRIPANDRCKRPIRLKIK